MKAPRAALLVFALWAAISAAGAQDFGFDAPKDANDPTAAPLIRDLAERIIPVYEEPDQDLYLSNLAALQLVTGNYAAAYDTAQSLRERHPDGDPTRTVDRAILYEIYARARAIEAVDHQPFPQAFPQAFREVVPTLDGQQAAAVMARLEAPAASFADAVQETLKRRSNTDAIPLPEALELIRRWLAFESRRSFAPFVAALNVDEQKRRYRPEEGTVIKLASGARIHAVIVRPSGDAKRPALLRFTDDPAENDARLSAAHGYVGVVAFVRGRQADGKGAITPFRFDGADARGVIDWIARQPWSDGRVGLYGDGYSATAAWSAAATPKPPQALKAVALTAPLVPGVDFPMQRQIVRNESLRWAQTQSGRKPPDGAIWTQREQRWFQSGRPYWDLDRVLLGRVSSVFRDWLTHPSDDLFWRKRRPAPAGLAALSIPVLSIAGRDDLTGGALFDFEALLRANPKADQRLLAGPWDAGMLRDGEAARPRGAALDPVARIDLRELRYQWFDHVIVQRPLPGLLADRVNVQLAGANAWRHAPTLDALASAPKRLFLGVATQDKPALVEAEGKAEAFVEASVDLGQRRALATTGAKVDDTVAQSLPNGAGIAFVGATFAQPLELAGRLRGHLDFVPNKQDLDLTLALYEQRTTGERLPLVAPYDFRLSYVGDRAERKLLRAGERQTLDFTVERVIGRRMAAGSRLVLVLGVARPADRQTNYGTGKAVSDETAADAGAPLRLRFYGGSFIELPARR